MQQAALKIVAINSESGQSSRQRETPRSTNIVQDLLPDSSARLFLAGLVASGVAVTSFIAYLVFKLPQSTPARNVVVGAFLEVALMLPPVYFFLLRPLRRYISERDAIARHLEERVCERTTDLQRSLAALEETHRESRILAELTELLQASNMASEAEEMLQRFGQKLFPGEYGAIYLYRSSRNILERAACWGSDTPEMFSPEDCWALRRGRVHASEPNGDQPLCRHLRGLAAGSASLCVPMMAQGNATGVLILNTRYLESTGADISRQSRTIAPLAAGQIALALANLQLREKLRDQAIRDPLTSMFNRRYFEETADRELRRLSKVV